MTMAAMVKDTILGMSKVLTQREDPLDFDEPWLQISNRGNKLKRKAQWMLSGQPMHTKARHRYTTSVEHAGYRRDILRRNPKRYDEDGDELDPEDEDEEADARAAEEDPYADIRLETLLAPLTSAAGLADHPSLSHPYLTSTLDDMVRHACDTMHREKKTLCNAKLLLRKLRGDETWIPTENLNDPDDEVIFDTDRVFQMIVADTSATEPGETNEQATATVSGGPSSRTVSSSKTNASLDDNVPGASQQGGLVTVVTTNFAPKEPGIEAFLIDPLNLEPPDVNMLDVEDNAAKVTASRAADATNELEQDAVDLIGSGNPQITQDTNGDTLVLGDAQIVKASSRSPDVTVETITKAIPTKQEDEELVEDDANGRTNDSEAIDADETSQQPPPRRMRTRAQAQAASEPTQSSHTASPEPPYVPPPIHPLFLHPVSAKPNADYGLPASEAEETRRMLMAYVQKQEEVCRSAEKLYQNLLRANRERMTVWRWCKAEAHVGEMSDGEDWCDKEEWGLDEDLKKGEGDEKEGEEVQGKKTRGRK